MYRSDNLSRCSQLYHQNTVYSYHDDINSISYIVCIIMYHVSIIFLDNRKMYHQTTVYSYHDDINSILYVICIKLMYRIDEHSRHFFVCLSPPPPPRTPQLFKNRRKSVHIWSKIVKSWSHKSVSSS
jgi:hypothetical protein